jgi:molybdopterin-guanine dinucleotide biosynthesis protein A
MKSSKDKEADWEICILAGGLSERMGRDKSRLRLGKRTMLARIRAEARKTALRVRVIRRDRVQRCGPLGGIYTALESTKADTILFLACDMPFVSVEMQQWLIRESGKAETGAFVRARRRTGFPFVVSRKALPLIQKQIEAGSFSIQTIAEKLKAKLLNVPRPWRSQLQNVNTIADLERAREFWEDRKK